MFSERTSVGLDVHARSVAAAAIDGVSGELVQARLSPSYGEIRSWVQRLPGPAAVTYEAGPTGFGLSRALNAAGIRCVVAAPSKLQRPSGDRVKTDAKDAIHLARLLRLDEITPVTVPTVEQETARDLVRAREDCRGDLMRARHRLSKLLLHQGFVYSGGQAWTGAHDQWLRQIGRRPQFDAPALRLTSESDYDAVVTVQARRARPITKTGNTHVRRLLIEAAWHHRARYRPGKTMRDRWNLATPAARARGDAGNQRLHQRWVRFTDRCKRPVIASVAIARELAGWCWSLAVLEE